MLCPTTAEELDSPHTHGMNAINTLGLNLLLPQIMRSPHFLFSCPSWAIMLKPLDMNTTK